MRASVIEDCKERERDMLLNVLRRIAVGRVDCGRPLAAEVARQTARETLMALGYDFKTER